MSHKIRIIIADDHHLMREGISRILNAEPDMEVLIEAENGQDAIRQCEALNPDLVLLDLDMPVMTGLDAAPILREKFPQLKIVILTMHKEKLLIEKMIKLGVDGYLYKSSDPKDLLRGIRQIHSGGKFYSSEVTENLVVAQGPFNSTDHSYSLKLEQLSDREKEILQCIAQGKSNTETGGELNISPRTVDTHRQNLLRKLEVKNVAGLVRFAIKSGLVE